MMEEIMAFAYGALKIIGSPFHQSHPSSASTSLDDNLTIYDHGHWTAFELSATLLRVIFIYFVGKYNIVQMI